jgi:hypothetical protein
MNKYTGSSLDDFLDEEGLLAECEAVAVKRVIAYQASELNEVDTNGQVDNEIGP